MESVETSLGRLNVGDKIRLRSGCVVKVTKLLPNDRVGQSYETTYIYMERIAGENPKGGSFPDGCYFYVRLNPKLIEYGGGGGYSENDIIEIVNGPLSFHTEEELLLC